MFRRVCFAGIVFLLAVISNVLAAPGDLDTSFNPPNGYTLYGGVGGVGNAVVIQPDGKIIVAGKEDVDHPELGEVAPAILILRYNGSGSLDQNFGANGVFEDMLTKVGDTVYGAAIQPDGKIVFGGDSGINEQAFVGRLNSDGTLDTTFAAALEWIDGYYKINYSGPPIVNGYTRFGGMALQPDGKTVLAANIYSYEQTGGGAGIAVIRLNSNGTPDSTFGAGGALILNAAGRHDHVSSLAIQEDGKIVLAGYAYNTADPTDCDIMLTRINGNGVLDSTFGSGGFVIKNLSWGDDLLNAVAIQLDGRIVATGRVEAANLDVGSPDVLVLRLNNNGTFDSTFGTGGITTTDLFEENVALGLAIQQNGGIVVTGFGHETTFFAIQYNSNGSLNNTFQPPNFCGPYGSFGSDVALQSDGKIVIAGSCRSGEFFEISYAMVLRVLGDPVSVETIIDNRDVNTSQTGTWHLAKGVNAYGPDSVWSRRNGSTFTWNFTPAATDTYNVSMWWTERPSGSTKIPVGIERAKIPVDIQHAGGTSRVYINQLINGGKWNLLGNYSFIKGTTYAITITSQPGPSSICADAVKIH